MCDRPSEGGQAQSECDEQYFERSGEYSLRAGFHESLNHSRTPSDGTTGGRSSGAVGLVAVAPGTRTYFHTMQYPKGLKGEFTCMGTLKQSARTMGPSFQLLRGLELVTRELPPYNLWMMESRSFRCFLGNLPLMMTRQAAGNQAQGANHGRLHTVTRSLGA